MDRRERGQELEAQVEAALGDLEAQMALGFTQGFLQILEFYANFHVYSPLNTLLIMMQKPEARLCAGFRKWEKLGYNVRKGEKALWIRGPMLKKVTDPDTGEVTERLIGYVGVPVFDISQLEGEVDLPTWRESLDGNYDEYYALALSGIAGTGVMVLEDQLPRGVYGMSSDGRIVIGRDLPVSEKFLTLLHEAAHQYLEHHKRHQETTKVERELIAESVSFVLARIYGLDNPYSRDYINLYRGTVEGLHDALSEIHLAVKKITAIIGIEPMKQEAATEAA
jgi:hypothetical protein